MLNTNGMQGESARPEGDVATLRPIPHRGARRRLRLDLVLAFVAAVVLANAVVGERGWLERWRARRQYAALATSIASLRQENERLRNQVTSLREDPWSIEMIARRDLGLLRRGEILVLVRNSRSSR
jgi:cell division protein FtsB